MSEERKPDYVTVKEYLDTVNESLGALGARVVGKGTDATLSGAKQSWALLSLKRLVTCFPV